MSRTSDEHISTSDFVSTGKTVEKPNEPRPAGSVGGAAMEPEAGPLFAADAANELRSRWDQIQTGFVDEPRTSVQQADELVAQAMKRLAESFSQERTRLEQQWDRGDQVNTEDLRVALRKYRSFFHRLLSV